jgi:hypothetical protein
MHDDQKEVFQALFATLLIIIFLALSALLLWPLGRATMTLSLMKGYWLFCIVVYPAAVVAVLLQRMCGVDLESRFDAYVISGLIVSGFLQAGWSAFAALTIHNFIAGASIPVVVLLYVVGFVSCFVAFNIVSTFYMGSTYRLINVSLAFAGFIIFSVWPAGGRALYGWFFDLF